MLKINRGVIFDTLRLKAKGKKKVQLQIFYMSVTRNSPLIDHTSTVRSLKLLEATRKEAIRTEGHALTNSANPCYWVFYLSYLSLLRFSSFDWIKRKEIRALATLLSHDTFHYSLSLQTLHENCFKFMLGCLKIPREVTHVQRNHNITI